MNISEKIKNYIIAVLILLLSITAYFLVKMKNELREGKKLDVIKKVEKPALPDSKGRIVIIIDDFGYRNDSVSEGFLELKEDITFAVIPGHEHSETFAGKAASAGFEVIVHMPMESKVSELREEPFNLTDEMTGKELESMLSRAYEQIPHAVGMNNHQGSLLTEDARAMAVVASYLKSNNKFFIDSRTTSGSIAEEQMIEFGVPVAIRRIFLDNDLDPNLISQQFDKLAYWAGRRGRAIGIGHAKQTTLEVIKKEIPRLKAEGYVFSFASTAVE